MSDDRPTEKISSKYYLLPALLGIIGAVIMYYKLRDRNIDMAKASLYIMAYSLITGIILIPLILMTGLLAAIGLSNPF